MNAIIEHSPEVIANNETEEATKTLTMARQYVIDCPELAEAAADDLGVIKGRMKRLDEQRMSLTRPLDEAKQRIMDMFKVPRQILEQAETQLKAAITDWNQKERARLEQERKVAEEAQRKAAEEARKAAEEAQRKAAEEQQLAMDLANTSPDMAAQAQAAAVTAQQEAQDAALAATQMQYMAPVVVEAKKLDGISSRQNWKAEVVDLMALVKAVAAGQASIELLEANTKVIGQRAKALKSDFQVPGVRVYAEETISARAK